MVAKSSTVATVAIAALVLIGTTWPSLAEVELRAVNPFPPNQIYAKEFARFVDALNAAGNGQVRVRQIGGPEAIPAPQQAGALKEGVVDLLFSPASFYRGQMVEVDALAGSTQLPWEIRSNGGFDLLDRIYQQKLSAKLLAWTGTGFGYHIFLRKEPKRLDNGSLDLKGVKVRSAPMYKEFFSSIGLVNVVLQIPEVYVALERGVVDGVGWPALGISDLGWDKFIKYRLDPPFLAGDAVVIVNLKKWKSLPESSRKNLEEAAKAYEHKAVEFYRQELSTEDGRLTKAGIKVVDLAGGARQNFLDSAYDEVWHRLEASGSPYSKDLKAKFYK
jgi:TRAP-type C4-dicarboxylate transport system substrate-binding protein